MRQQDGITDGRNGVGPPDTGVELQVQSVLHTERAIVAQGSCPLHVVQGSLGLGQPLWRGTTLMRRKVSIHIVWGLK